jgi:hypothetical protein
MSVGIAGALVSLFALGYGFAYNGFDLGNTLIIAGAVGLGASLVLVGMAAALRELRRIADAVTARAERGVPASEPAETAAGRATARIPYPPKPEPTVRERPSDVRMGDVRMADPQVAMEGERPRNIFATARAESPLVPEPEAPPLAQVRPSMAPPSAPAEPPYEPKFGPADILARIGGGRAPKPELPREARPPAMETPVEPPAANERAEPEPARRGRGMFDGVWPAEPPTGAGEAEPPARAPRPELRSEPRHEPRPEPKPEPKPELRPEPRPETRYELRRPRAEPPPLQSAVTPPAAPPPGAPAEARPSVESQPASILKSGVIDGMAYTLYTDGSIEAQLPQGTVHFASIEELRMHLEKNG